MQLLNNIRKNLDYEEKVNFKKLRKGKGKKHDCIKSWLCIAVGALLQRKKTFPLPSFPTCITPNSYDTLNKIIGAKFILFRERDSHVKLDNRFYPDLTSKIETTFRIGLKGGIHLLGSQENPIKICSIHFDGHEHHGRHIDRDRIIGRLNGLRAYCSFEKNVFIDDRSSDHRKDNCQDYSDCQYLQLTDLLVGSFRQILKNVERSFAKKLNHPTRELVKNWKQGPARMKNSRWIGGYCLSECYLENGSWNFNEIISNQEISNQLEIQF